MAGWPGTPLESTRYLQLLVRQETLPLLDDKRQLLFRRRQVREVQNIRGHRFPPGLQVDKSGCSGSSS